MDDFNKKYKKNYSLCIRHIGGLLKGLFYLSH